jgi:AcrR family transcriptional regulator
MATVILRQTRPRGEVRRVQILEAAKAVFLEKGYAGTTIDQVVKRAGASNASIYSFFGGKDGLFAAMIGEYSGRLLETFQTIDIDDATVPAALAQIGRHYMDCVLAPDAVAVCRLILAEGTHFPELVDAYYRHGLDRVTKHIADIFTTWRSCGFATMDDPVLTAAQFLDAVGGRLLQRAVAGLPTAGSSAAIEYSIQNAVRIFSTAIRGREQIHEK